MNVTLQRYEQRTTKNPNEELHNNLQLVKRVLAYRRNNKSVILNGKPHGDIIGIMVLAK
jgi:hypothetical protein